MAEREGFEPSVEFPLRRFSKPVPSATRPPLQQVLRFVFGLGKLAGIEAARKPDGTALLGEGGAGMLSAMWQRRLFPAVAELGLAFVGLLVGWVVASVLVTTVLGLLPEGAPRAAAGLLLGPVITAVAALAYLQLATRWPRVAAHAPPPVSRTSIPRTTLIIVGGVLVALAGSIAFGLLFKAIGLEVEEQAAVVKIVEDARTGGSILPAVVLCISATLFAPLAEEWLFRGLLYRRIRTGAGPALAYIVSAIAFAAIHDNPAGFAVYLWLGLVFAATLQLTGRLAAAMAVHLGNNAFVLVTLFLGIDELG